MDRGNGLRPVGDFWTDWLENLEEASPDKKHRIDEMRKDLRLEEPKAVVSECLW